MIDEEEPITLSSQIPSGLPYGMQLILSSLQYDDAIFNPAVLFSSDIFTDNEITYIFPFIPDLFILIEEYEPENSECIDYIAKLIIVSLQSWIGYSKETKDFKYIDLVTNAISQYTHSSYTHILLKIYSYILRLYSHKSKSFDLSLIFESLINLYYSQSIDLSCLGQDIFEITNALFSSPQASAEDKKVFLNFLSENALKNEIFSTKNAEEVIIMISSMISSLEVSALELYSILSSMIPIKTSINLIKIIPQSLVVFFKGKGPFHQDPTIEKDNLDFIECSSEIKFEYSTKETFERHLPLLLDQPYISYENQDKFTTNIYMMLKCIAEACMNTEGGVCCLLNCFKPLLCQPDCSYDIVIAYIKIISGTTLNANQSRVYIDTILRTPLFSNFSAIGSKNDLSIQYRIEAFNVLLSSSESDISYFVSKTAENPYIFPDVMKILCSNFMKIPITELTSFEFINALIRGAAFFQEQHKYATDINLEVIESCRKSIFYVFQVSLKRPEFAHSLSVSDFIYLMFSMFCEESVRDFAIHLMRSIILCEQVTIVTEFTKQIDKSFTVLINLFDDDNIVKVASHAVNLLNEICKARKSSVFRFQNIFSMLIDCISRVTTTPNSHQIFISILSLIIDSLCYAKLTKQQLDLIGQAALKLTNPEYSEEINDKLKALLSGGAEHGTLFFIKQPGLLHVCFLKCRTSEEKIETLDLYYNIFLNSIYNKQVAFDADFDDFLVEELNKLRDKPNEFELVNKIVDVLETLIPYFITDSTIIKVFALLMPLNSITTSEYHSAFVRLTMNVIKQSRNNRIYIPLKGNTSVIEVQNIDTNSIKDHFNISCTIFFEPVLTKSSFCILKLSNIFSINYTNGKLYLHSMESQEPKEFNIEIGTGKWVDLRFDFIISSESETCEVLMKCSENASDIVEFKWPNTDAQYYKLTSAITTDPSYVLPVGYLAGFSIDNLFNLTFNISERFVETQLFGDTQSAVIIGPPVILQDGFDRTILRHMQLIFTIFDECLLNVRMSKIDTINRNEEIICEFLEILQNIAACKGSQEILTLHKFPRLTGYLITEYAEGGIHIYQTAKNCLQYLTYPMLRAQMLKHVIYNFSVWKHDTDQIFEDWDHNFNLESASSLGIVEASNYIKENDVPKSLLNFIAKSLSKTINNHSISYLIGECLTCTDMNKVDYYLDIFITIASTTKLEFLTKLEDTFLLLQHLIGYCNQNVFVKLIKLLCLAHVRKILPFDPNRHFAIIAQKTPQKMCTMDVLQKILEFAPMYPFIIPLIGYISSEIGPEGVDLAIKNLPKLQEEPSDDVILWMLIMFQHSYDKEKVFDILFNLNCIERIYEILTLLEASSVFSDIAIPFLELCVDCAILRIKEMGTDYIVRLLQICYTAILFQTEAYKEEWIQSMFQSSPFKLSNLRRKSSSFNMSLNCSLQKNVERCVDIKFIFGLRLDERGRWIDSTLAIKCTVLFEKVIQSTKIMNQLLPYDMTLCSYLIRSNPHDVKAHIETVGAPALSPRLTKNIIYKVIARASKVHIEFPMFKDIEVEHMIESFDFMVEELTLASEIEACSARIRRQWEADAKEEKHHISVANRNVVDNAIKADEEFKSSQVTKKMKYASQFVRVIAGMPHIHTMTEANPHFVRNGVLAEGVPMLMDINTNYTNHSKASDLRDKGVGEKDLEVVYEQSMSGVPTDYPITLVTVRGEFDGYFVIKENDIEIWTPQSTIIITKESVDVIEAKEYLHKDNAVEFYLNYNRTYFVVFKDKFPEDLVRTKFDIMPYLKQWITGAISNFEYLLALNRATSRSFNCLSQYPVFPWVISDYKSSELNLNKQKTFRDLSLPFHCIDSRVNKALKKAKMPFICSQSMLPPQGVLFYLLREEPFTTEHIKLQNGRFDEDARLFNSVAEAYDNPDMLYELIPEFFYGGLFLDDKNGLNLKYPSVQLPPYAKNSSDFVYKNRCALESAYVSAHLNEWIDLMWGVKQGQDLNRFDPELCHESGDLLKCQLFGCVPRKLFAKPHPRRLAKLAMKLPKAAEKLTLPQSTTSRFFPPRTLAFVFDGELVKGEIDDTMKFTEKSRKKVGQEMSECVLVDGDQFVGVSKDRRHIVSNLQKTPRFDCPISAFAADEASIVVGTEDSNIYVFDTDNLSEPRGSCVFYSPISANRPMCAAVSSEHGVGVVCSSTSVRIVSLRDVAEIRIRSVRGASQVAVVRGGLIAVCLKGAIEVLSLTGDLIGQIPTSLGPLNGLSPFVDWRGIPCIAGQGSDGSLVVADLGGLSSRVVGSVGFVCCSVSYLSEYRSMLCISYNGGCLFLPLE